MCDCLASSTTTEIANNYAPLCMYVPATFCSVFIICTVYMGVSNRWTEIWNGTVEWKIVHSDCVAATVQSRLSYLL